MTRMMRAGLVVAVVLVAAPAGLRAEHEAATPAQELIEETIHDYLLSHPDVMLEVFDILRARQEATDADAARLNLASYREELLNDPAAPVAGNPNGDVTLVEFFDYHCTYCKRVMPAMLKSLEDDPGLRIVYKEFPILGPDSVIASRAALAARDTARAIAAYQSIIEEDDESVAAAEAGFRLAELRTLQGR